MRLAPPCSTSSQARSIPLAGRRGPEPLRSWQHPDGLATLGFAGRCHVNAANKLYCRTASLLQACVHASVHFSVENPAGSHFWNTSFMRGFFKANRATIQFVQFDHCCSGGTRRKTIALWRNLSALSNFGVLCRPDLNHVHDEWGIAQQGSFETSEETAYLVSLCIQWPHCCSHQAIQEGYTGHRRIRSAFAVPPQDLSFAP